jgi:hypothetical protein
MQLSSAVVRGEVNGRRAEVRLANGVVRLQVLTLVSQQPALDLATPVSRLQVFRIRSRPQWFFGAALFAVGIYSQYFASAVPVDIRETAAVSFAALGTVGLGLGFLFPVISLHIADPEHTVVVQLSRFSRSRANRLVREVCAANPALGAPAA